MPDDARGLGEEGKVGRDGAVEGASEGGLCWGRGLGEGEGEDGKEERDEEDLHGLVIEGMSGLGRAERRVGKGLARRTLCSGRCTRMLVLPARPHCKALCTATTWTVNIVERKACAGHSSVSRDTCI